MPITIKANNQYNVVEGTHISQFVTDVSYPGYSLLSGHTLQSITFDPAGPVALDQDTITLSNPVIVDGSSNNVTDKYYVITLETGSLTVIP